MILHRLSWFSW